MITNIRMMVVGVMTTDDDRIVMTAHLTTLHHAKIILHVSHQLEEGQGVDLQIIGRVSDAAPAQLVVAAAH